MTINTDTPATAWLVPHLDEYSEDPCRCGIAEVTQTQASLLIKFDEWYGDKSYRKHNEVAGWADLIAEVERERILGVEDPNDDDEEGILDQYEMIIHEGIVGWLCRRCPHIGIIARDMSGNQAGLTLAEMAWSALAHEAEVHAGGAA